MKTTVQEKILSIKEATEVSDLSSLQLFCKSKGGLINNALRCQVWPILLDIDPNEFLLDPSKLIKLHQYTDQIERDVERSLWKFVSDEDRPGKRTELSAIINAIMSTCPNLHYFQGYHDIASVFLLVCGEKMAYLLLKRLSFYHIRDNLNPDMDCNIHVMKQVTYLLEFADPELANFIKSAGLPPYYGLSWLLTWFSHNIDEIDTVARLFDYFLVSSPYAPLYLSVAIMVHNRKGILLCENDTLYTYLSNLTADHNIMPWEELIQRSEKFLKSFPPEKSLDLPPPNSNMKSYPYTHMSDNDSDTGLWISRGSTILVSVFGIVLTAYLIGYWK